MNDFLQSDKQITNQFSPMYFGEVRFFLMQ